MNMIKIQNIKEDSLGKIAWNGLYRAMIGKALQQLFQIEDRQYVAVCTETCAR